MSSSDSDDVPIGELVARKRAEEDDAASGAGGDDDGADDGNDDDFRPSSDSDDDLPVAQLLKQRKAKSGAKSPKSTSSRSTAKKRKAPAKKKKSSSAASVASSTKRARTKSAAPRSARTLSRDKPLKDQAIAAVLSRWRYCMTWPPPSFEADAHKLPSPASDWVRMPGFPGVFVGVMNDATGKVVDRRPTKGRPSYAELAERPASELKEMWIKAIEGQLEDLRKHEGDDAPLVSVLEKELKLARKFKASKADKEARFKA